MREVGIDTIIEEGVARFSGYNKGFWHFVVEWRGSFYAFRIHGKDLSEAKFNHKMPAKFYEKFIRSEWINKLMSDRKLKTVQFDI